MPIWEISSLIVIGVMLLIAAIRFGFLGFLIDIICAVASGDHSDSDGGSFGGGGFGGGGSNDSF